MPRDDCVTFKIFFNDTNGTTEVKKFVIDGDTSIITNFLFIREKLLTVFPKLRDVNFKITWRDAEGDDIVLENDEDLILAFTEMDGALKTLSVTALETSSSRPDVHNVVCDVCNKKITAYRYKCLQCPDYDLCNDCEHAGHHSHHMMLRTATPELPFERCGRRIFDQVNKAMKKASYMAHKEYRRRPRCDRKKCDKPGETCGGEGTSKKDGKDQECPFEEYVPHFYPFMANIATHASAAMNAAHASANAAAAGSKQSEGQAKNATEDGDEHNPASQFMEAIRNVLSAFVPQTPTPSPNETNQSNPPEFNGGNTNQQSQQPNQNGAPTAPHPTNETHVDLTISTSDEPMDVTSSQRETGWTILTHDDHPANPKTLFPVLTPTVTPTSVVQPTQPRVVQTPAFSVGQPLPTQQQQIPQFAQQAQQQPQIQQNPPQQPQQSQQTIYPSLFQAQFPRAQIQDPKIAAGLKQLFEMGFTDEQSLIALLKRFNGNVDEVIRNIFERK
ncbi:Zinc finger, ZZ type [Popillia japonica]|uniref:Zinc finger, ZZ type n=1 Tax=Popillia japonica TaxID=7064 RepID=A0AAW1M3H7_POPJA